MLIRHESLLQQRVQERATVPGRSRERHFPELLRVVLLALVVMVAALSTMPAMAQVESATLRGVISSAEGPESGIEVVAENTATGQTRRATTGNDLAAHATTL